MDRSDLTRCYRDYVACLNAQDWPALGRFVHDDVTHNGRRFGLPGYRRMLEGDFEAIPDLRFDVGLLVVDPPTVASRLCFDCTPTGEAFGLRVDGKRVSFSENVFYRFRDGRIAEVWSIIDKAAIAAQLDGGDERPEPRPEASDPG